MKRISFICLLILLCSLPGQAQFWISFGWNEPHCQSCLWMEQAMRLNGRQAADYHNIVHKYGQRIEKEARKHYRYWDQSAKKIFNLRMERDRKLQRVLSPSQFRLYVRFVRERPQRIHDYQGWYNNPHYPNYRPLIFAGAMKTITGIINGNIQMDDGMGVLMTASGIGVNTIVPIIMITDSGVRTIIIVPIITSISINRPDREMIGTIRIKDRTTGETTTVIETGKTKTEKKRIKRKKTINGRKVNALKFTAEAENY
ncbi:hypothetical protein [Parabacteroides sp. AM58-2XD]|uniref:hypothetical protein n=1 Tax=Parabacteroides sp. AM58-2XD TaxID=2292362 RepID=UPI001F4693B5|nr:hypothetical protein [Parabacteroides sp. AM58-2XD]